MALRDSEQVVLLEQMKRKAKKSGPKFNNRHVKLDGYTFDSIAEAGRYVILVDAKRAEKIAKLRVHPKYEFDCGGTFSPDFSYYKVAPGRPSRLTLVIEDVKSDPTRTSLYKRNRAQMRHEYGLEIVEVEMDAVVAQALVAGYAGSQERKHA